MEQSMNKYIGRLLDDRYELLEIIGSGGMSVVYKALDYRLNRYVAIKMLRDEIFADPDLKAQFQAEAQAVAMLSHPNIVAVYDVSHSQRGLYRDGADRGRHAQAVHHKQGTAFHAGDAVFRPADHARAAPRP